MAAASKVKPGSTPPPSSPPPHTSRSLPQPRHAPATHSATSPVQPPTFAPLPPPPSAPPRPPTFSPSRRFVYGSSHTRKQIKPFEAVKHMQESTHKVRKVASQVVLSRVQLTHPSRDSPNTSPRFALDARDVCLVGENSTCSVPAL